MYHADPKAPPPLSKSYFVFDPGPNPSFLLSSLAHLVSRYIYDQAKPDPEIAIIIADATRLAAIANSSTSEYITMANRSGEEKATIERLCTILSRLAPDGYTFAHLSEGFYGFVEK